MKPKTVTLRPRRATLMAIGVIALGLSLIQCDLLITGCRERLEPLCSRVGASLERLRCAASEGIARGREVRVPGAAFAAIPMGCEAAALDRDGYVASIDSLGNLEDIPLLTGFRLGSCEPGAFASSPQAFLGITVVKAFETTPGLMGLLKSVDLKDLENPEVILKTETVVRLGAGNYALKLGRLREVLSQTTYLGMKPNLIDLRFRDQVVVRPGAIKSTTDREV